MCHKTFAIFMKFHEAKDCGILYVLLLVEKHTLRKSSIILKNEHNFEHNLEKNWTLLVA